MKKIGVVTATRAEYGLLRPIIENLKKSYDVKIIVTGTHLSSEFGLTYKEIEEDGLNIDEKIEILMSSDTNIGISKSIGLAMISFSEALNRLELDSLIILGDRYEIFAVATVAAIAKIPIIHLHGGETTEGAYDEFFRHSISKMSTLHLASTEEYRKRIIQLGENPQNVKNVGAIGVDNAMNLKLIDKFDLEQSIDFDLGENYCVVTLHPETLSELKAEYQVNELTKALNYFPDMKFLITKANADSDGRAINRMLENYEKENNKRIKLVDSLGYLKYLSAVKLSKLVIGNSSSGIIEVPSFKVPTINIGDRQKGRIQSKSVINTFYNSKEIIKSMKLGLSNEFNESIIKGENPYGDGNALEKIISNINLFLKDDYINFKKKFYDL